MLRLDAVGRRLLRARARPADGLGINPQDQKTRAGYAAVYFEHGDLDGNLGVRVVQTDATGHGLLKFDPGGLTPVLPPDDLAFANGASIDHDGTKTAIPTYCPA